MKDQKSLEITVRDKYLELGSCRKVSKALDIKLYKVRDIILKYDIMKPRKISHSQYLLERNITIKQLKDTYLKLNCHSKTAKELKLGICKTRKILKDLGILKKAGHALEYNKNGENNPFYGKTHNKKTKQKLSNYAKQRTAKRNPNYKHGNYIRRPRDYKISVMTKLRNFVFNRDNYICIYCKNKGNYLHAHHRIPFWVEPKAFEDTDNMITVCTKCHFSKAHLGNWAKFDINLISNELLTKYSLDRERLSGLTVIINNRSDSLISSNI